LKKQSSKKKSHEQHSQIEVFIQEAISTINSSKLDFFVGKLDSAEGQNALLIETIKSIQKEHPEVAVLLLSADAKKVTILAKVPPSILKSKALTANKWASETAQACGGKGGGKPDTASGSGNDIHKVGEAVQTAIEFAKKNL